MAKRVAVVDIGSNSVRLAIYEKTSRFAFHLLNESKSKVRLSQNIYQNDGNLQEVAMQRTIDALRGFLEIISSYKARKTLCVATSALRDAPNKKQFIKRVKDELKLNIKVIDGKKEAYFGAIACSNLLPNLQDAISVDIGGGSTELAIINDANVSNPLSINLGTVRLKELFFDNNDIEGAKRYIDDKLSPLDDVSASTMVGIGGTIRAISSAMLLRVNHPLDKLHAFTYKRDALDDFISLVLEADTIHLDKLNIKPERYDIIKPGVLILQRIIKKLSIKKIVSSGVGVREGVYLSDMLRYSKDRFPVHYNTSTRYILDTFVDDKTYSNNLNKLSKEIFDLTYEFLNIDKKYRHELSLSAKLYPAGSGIHFFSMHKHSYYIIQSALEYGYTHSQTTLIATLCRYATRKLPSQDHIDKYAKLLPSKQTLNALSYILSLSVSLLTHKPRNIDFKLSFNNDTLKINSNNNLYIAKEKIAKLQTIDMKVDV